MQSFRRPIGFAPAEISALINEEVVSQHAEEAAFLWTMRDRAVREPHYALDDLTVLDERVEAQLDGLRLSGKAGWKWCKANVENVGPGEVFALTSLAFGTGDRDQMREALFAGCSSTQTTRGFISALGWLDLPTILPAITRLLHAISPMHRAMGIRACAVHRHDPGDILSKAVTGADAMLCAAALRTCGELRRFDLHGPVRTHLRGGDESCRFWAAWSLALNGERDGVVELARWFDGPEEFAMRALSLALRVMSLDESREQIRALLKAPELRARAVFGAGVVGDPASVPWLIQNMESPDLARLAGEAFTMITGVDLAFHDLDQDAPVDAAEASVEDIVELGYESNLPWPSPDRVATWWGQNQRAFTPGTRFLVGKPISPESAREVWMRGKQRQRTAAALELAIAQPDRPILEARARADWQRRSVGP